MDRSNSLNRKIPQTLPTNAASTEKTGPEITRTATTQSSMVAAGTELPAPTLSTRPKLTHQRVYGDADGRDDSSGSTGTSSRRARFQAAVQKAKASRLKNALQSTVADLTKTYPAISASRSRQKKNAGVGVSSQTIRLSNGGEVFPNLPAFVREGTTARVILRKKADVLELAKILDKNLDIRSLKISGSFGGRRGMDEFIRMDPFVHLAALEGRKFEPLDDECFRVLLSSISQIQSLELSGCGLTEKNFIDLSVFLQTAATPQTLVLGGGDSLSVRAQEAMATGIAANSSLRKLVLEDLCVESDSLPPLLYGLFTDAAMDDQPLIEGIKANRSLESVKLHDANRPLSKTPIFSFRQVATLFGPGSRLREVSLAGTKLGSPEPNAADNQLEDDYLDSFWPMSLSWLPRQDALQKEPPVEFGESLEALDLSGCLLTQSQMHQLISSLPLGSSLAVLNLDKDRLDPSDAEALQHKLSKSKPRLLEDGASAYQFLVSNSVNAPLYWPSEISRALATFTPIADLLLLSDALAEIRRPFDNSTEQALGSTLDTSTTTTTRTTTGSDQRGPSGA